MRVSLFIEVNSNGERVSLFARGLINRLIFFVNLKVNYNIRRNIVSIYDFARGYVNSKDIIVLNVIS